MALELSDAVGHEQIEVAVGHMLRLHAQQCDAPLEELARAVVDEVFCMCVTSVADAIEHRLSTMHAAIVAEVLRRGRQRMVGQLRAYHE